MLNINNLEKYLCNGVWCLVNALEKKVDVRYSSNLLLSIVTVLSQIKDGSVQPHSLVDDCNKLELVVLEKDLPADVLKIKHGQWIRYYQKQGYKLYRKNLAANWKICTAIENLDGEYRFTVKLVSKNNTLVVGIFDNNVELNWFLEEYYSAGVQSIVFANNTQTASYNKKQKMLKAPKLL